MDYRQRFRVKPGSPVDLASIDPAFTSKYKDKSAARRKIAEYGRQMYELQYLLYAEGRRSLLIVLQSLDAGGKDGIIAHVLGAMNPQGTHVHSFKHPSGEEIAHDFLWRPHLYTPRHGEVGIFNRSHYEDVLVVRVHELVPWSVWSARYELINDFEKNLIRNGTHILKFYLHMSPEEQLKRFKDRLDNPARQWKISESDYTERTLWPRYMEAYEDALARTSTEDAPWFVIPADNKWFRNLAVSRIVVETLESLRMKTPPPSVNIDEIRHKYHAETQHKTP